jgi:L-ascorbate metabolism protein UlaG (beta-lactamase superfamily)
MKITWLGHACFLVEDSKGTRVLTDPFDINPQLFADRGLKFDYPPISGVQADLVLISHEHFDHNAAGVVEGSPIIIRRTGKFAIAGVSGVAVDGEHDQEEGRLRGSNLLMCWEMEGLRLCHFGDFGQAALRPEQIEALGRVDILFLPVGGDQQKGPTVDAVGARQIVDVLNPHLIFPMHYATKAVNFLQPVDNFLGLMNQVEEKGTTSVEISPNQVLSLSLTVFVLDSPKEAYKNEH